MQIIPFQEQYGLLKKNGVSPFVAITTMCRNNPGYASWIVEWFACKSPDAGAFRDHWLKRKRAEVSDYLTWVGCVDEGCYQYFSYAHRPRITIFIKWNEIESIFIQDGQDHLQLAIYSHKKDEFQFLMAQDDMTGFTAFVEEVSERFFERRDYLDSTFKRGQHPIRKWQVWPKNELPERPAVEENGG